MESYGIGIVPVTFDREFKYLFTFGAYGCVHVLVIGEPGVCEALEEAAGWLAEHAPGHLIKFGSEEHTALLREACEDKGAEWDSLDDEDRWEVNDAACVDLTYTESGYLPSHEWTFTVPDRDYILLLQKRDFFG
jgi:hypothetical protein